MRYSINKIIIISSMVLIVMFGIFVSTEVYSEDKITIQKLSGTCWTHDANDVPWAIQFNEDGTFRITHTVLDLRNYLKSRGSFNLKETR